MSSLASRVSAMVAPDDELDALHDRLREAPEDLRALQAGELDAIVGLRAAPSELYVRSSSEQIYRLIIERMREGAVLVPRGVDTVVYCNRSFADMVALTPDRVVGGSLMRWLEPVDAPPVRALLDADEPLQGDYRLRPTAGPPLPVSISATLVEEGAASLRCLIVNDLRIRRDAERLRQVRAELELSHQRKNEFLATLGHELRNPLAPVRQAVELIVANAGPGDPPYLVSARGVLARQVMHLKRLVDDLLDVGRVTKGTLTVERSLVDLRDAIVTAKESVERLIERRRHRVRVELPAEPMRVMGDVVRLTQVFANLFSNAAKYTPDGGQLVITAAPHEQGHRVSVKDDGRGIEPELIPYLFEPFVQSEATLDRAAGGIGVGLTLVRRIVELHDGRVAAHSDGPGRGSEFQVWLPAASSNEAQPGPERTEAIPTPAARRILVVDDNEDAAEMLALVLRKRGYEVELAFDGAQALRVVQEGGAEVVLLDIGLPDMDGYEVARALRADPAGTHRVLIALTGYGQPEDLERSREAGFDHHLIKPVAIDDVLSVMRRRDGSA
ncbi:MAG: response regulator [Myxococcales bacterium]|nr:response regulator [Myxococcales bacterium]